MAVTNLQSVSLHQAEQRRSSFTLPKGRTDHETKSSIFLIMVGCVTEIILVPFSGTNQNAEFSRKIGSNIVDGFTNKFSKIKLN